LIQSTSDIQSSNDCHILLGGGWIFSAEITASTLVEAGGAGWKLLNFVVVGLFGFMTVKSCWSIIAVYGHFH
jgi:hypothetical protein